MTCDLVATVERVERLQDGAVKVLSLSDAKARAAGLECVLRELGELGPPSDIRAPNDPYPQTPEGYVLSNADVVTLISLRLAHILTKLLSARECELEPLLPEIRTAVDVVDGWARLWGGDVPRCGPLERGQA